ncbi:MAG: ansA [Naasia sp.]|jgi:L-asparaginase II|uniref:asparaginase n=1 Tax=Naasia sp. TaxID=2546198 RepID=UPI00262972F2|nr:asparaginase [Naasia sp.]MCU1571626.1 ansA [Naasia sp.]
MRGTFAAADAVELAVVERSGFVESRHVGSAVVLAPDGAVRRELGDVRAPLFPRSSLKPFQALASMASGGDLSAEELVLSTASHHGTIEQAKIVRGILKKAGLPISALGCPADWPSDRHSRDELIRTGHGPLPIFHNCSGKHAAMLLACVRSGWDTRSYLDPAHPLQERVREVIQRMTGEHVSITGVDGCGAPVHAISLTGLAAGFSRIRTTRADSPWPLYRDAAALTQAVLEHPALISGEGGQDAVLIEELGGLAKVGAEGVFAVATPEGHAVAVKTLDGSLRAVAAVAADLLASVGAIDGPALARVRARLDLVVQGGGRPVGQIRVTCV